MPYKVDDERAGSAFEQLWQLRTDTRPRHELLDGLSSATPAKARIQGRLAPRLVLADPRFRARASTYFGGLPVLSSTFAPLRPLAGGEGGTPARQRRGR